MRIVALGASDLTRGLPSLVAAARDRWGRDVEVVAALGRPGILQSGLWDALDRLPRTATRAPVTDVGNDILYGFERVKPQTGTALPGGGRVWLY